MIGLTETVTTELSLREGVPWSIQRTPMLPPELSVKLSPLCSKIDPLVNPIETKLELEVSEYLHTKYTQRSCHVTGVVNANVNPSGQPETPGQY